MPCGGIFPVNKQSGYYAPNKDTICFYCNKKGTHIWSFCEEWDCFIHDTCIDKFLKTEEGKVVLRHNHPVIRRTLHKKNVKED